MFKRRKRFARALADAPDSARIWELESDGVETAGAAAPPEDPPEATYDAVYDAVETEDLDDDLFELLARGYPLISERPPETIPRATADAMHAAAAVGYFAREVQANRNGGADAPHRPEVGDGDPAQAAAELAADATLPPRDHELRERTLSIAVRESDSGGLISPGGEITDAGMDDFRRAWKFGFLVAELAGGGARTAAAKG